MDSRDRSNRTADLTPNLSENLIAAFRTFNQAEQPFLTLRITFDQSWMNALGTFVGWVTKRQETKNRLAFQALFSPDSLVLKALKEFRGLKHLDVDTGGVLRPDEGTDDDLLKRMNFALESARALKAKVEKGQGQDKVLNFGVEFDKLRDLVPP